MGGFRLKLCIKTPEAMTDSFVFVAEEIKYINQLMEHIKKVFFINKDISLYIDGAVLPPSETINLIQPNDKICVEISDDMDMEEPKKKRKRKHERDIQTPPQSSDFSEVQTVEQEGIEIKKKRKRKHKRDRQTPSQSSDISEVQSMKQEEAEIDCLSKKKRKRKKNSTDISQEEMTDISNELLGHSSKSQHIFFPQDDDDDTIGGTSDAQSSRIPTSTADSGPWNWSGGSSKFLSEEELIKDAPSEECPRKKRRIRKRKRSKKNPPQVSSEGEIIESSREEIIESSREEIIESSQGEIIESSQGEIMEPSQGEIMEPSQGEIMEPSQGEIIESSLIQDCSPPEKKYSEIMRDTAVPTVIVIESESSDDSIDINPSERVGDTVNTDNKESSDGSGPSGKVGDTVNTDNKESSSGSGPSGKVGDTVNTDNKESSNGSGPSGKVEDTTDTDLNVGDSESSEKDNEVDIQSGPTSDISSMQNSNADSFLKEVVPVIILREKEVVTPIVTLKEEAEDVKPKLDDLNQGDARPKGGYRTFFSNKIRYKLNAMSIIPDVLEHIYGRTHLIENKIKPARNPIKKIKEETTFQLEIGKKIIFQKIKIGQDYCPVQSDDITAIVESVEGDSTELKIIGGYDEFKEPTGKFSFEDDKEDTLPNKPFKVKFNNWEILNPRFK